VFQTSAEKGLPIVRLNLVERAHDVVEIIRQFAPIAIIDAEKGAGEIVQGPGAAGKLADQAVGIEPNEQSLIIVIFGALPASPSFWLAVGDDGSAVVSVSGRH